jgi:hypothetical protein
MKMEERINRARTEFPDPYGWLNAQRPGLGDRIEKVLTVDQAAHFTAGMLANAADHGRSERSAGRPRRTAGLMPDYGHAIRYCGCQRRFEWLGDRNPKPVGFMRRFAGVWRCLVCGRCRF